MASSMDVNVYQETWKEERGGEDFDSPSVALKALANDLYHARQEGDPVDSLVANSLQHFARSRSDLRAAATSHRLDKAAVQETRTIMDTTFLAQQNRKYEVNHLYREIDKCNDYE